MLPHERSLVEKMKGKPFVLFGVNSDPKDKAKEIFEKNGVTWPNLLQGSTSGPISTEWNVTGWPTIYVLDAKGAIRYKGVRDKAMEEAVETLLKEIQ